MGYEVKIQKIKKFNENWEKEIREKNDDLRETILMIQKAPRFYFEICSEKSPIYNLIQLISNHTTGTATLIVLTRRNRKYHFAKILQHVNLRFRAISQDSPRVSPKRKESTGQPASICKGFRNLFARK